MSSNREKDNKFNLITAFYFEKYYLYDAIDCYNLSLMDIDPSDYPGSKSDED